VFVHSLRPFLDIIWVNNARFEEYKEITDGVALKAIFLKSTDLTPREMFNGSYERPSTHVRTSGQEQPPSSSRRMTATNDLSSSGHGFQVRADLVAQRRLFTCCEQPAV
jgi:hypothetical protein